ncbi:putative redox protein fmp46, mitochondrial [Madurella mycetomatis]|uniref:Redox protein fmp46, mitochondrial n=1 Tax=Madurella mycetomatis TaxID=100816 RepID=A0A175W6V7_9PEZI|nr:putative redox protein fmp46, mitochondrial [Madurella mycetomatis]
MFRFRKSLDIITLFHKASSPASVRIATALKQKSAAAWETATEDQASDHSAQSSDRTPQFELQITEQAPTPDQLKTILDYVGPKSISRVIKGATTEQEALRKFKENVDNFQRPVVVDWNNGKAQASENESEILKMLDEIKRQ